MFVNSHKNRTAAQLALEDNEPEIAAILQEDEKNYVKNKKSSSSSTAEFLAPFLKVSASEEVKDVSKKIDSNEAKSVFSNILSRDKTFVATASKTDMLSEASASAFNFLADQGAQLRK